MEEQKKNPAQGLSESEQVQVRRQKLADLQAHSRRPCCSKFVTSAEKVEKVVNPPRNPVMTSRRHSGERAG